MSADPQLAAGRFWAKVNKSGDCWNWVIAKRNEVYTHNALDRDAS